MRYDWLYTTPLSIAITVTLIVLFPTCRSSVTNCPLSITFPFTKSTEVGSLSRGVKSRAVKLLGTVILYWKTPGRSWIGSGLVIVPLLLPTLTMPPKEMLAKITPWAVKLNWRHEWVNKEMIEKLSIINLSSIKSTYKYQDDSPPSCRC